QTLEVNSSSRVVLLGHNATIFMGAPTISAILRIKNGPHVVEGITFEGGGQTSGLGVIVEGTAPRSHIRNCRFINIPGSAIQLQAGANYCNIHDNYFDSCGHGSGVSSPFNTTIYITDANYCSVKNNTLLNCNWGIYFRGTTEIVGYICEGNFLTGASSATANQGISSRFGKSSIIKGNSIVNFKDNAIDLYGCQHINVIGNNTQGCKDGVFVGDITSRYVTIQGNVFRGPQRGVRIYNDTNNANQVIADISVIGNVIQGATDGGILASKTGSGSTMARILIVGNSISIDGAGNYGVQMVGCET